MTRLALHDFRSAEVDAGDVRVFVRWAGTGPPVLLLHGFPQTHLMWRDVAPLLARRFTIVCVDLPGYGSSGCPPDASDHGRHSKRALAWDLVSAMQHLGHARFAVAGHDRGGRVAYRLALDHPERVAAVAVLDIVPTFDAWALADARLALGYWPWSLLAQPQPLPERVLLACADTVVDHALRRWGSPTEAFPPRVRQAYVESLRDPAHAHAICEEYRAAATLDREHDQADRLADRRITCPLLVLWSAAGPLNQWYADAGGPLGVWRRWAKDVRGVAVNAGHFFPEEAPAVTARALQAFFAQTLHSPPSSR